MKITKEDLKKLIKEVVDSGDRPTWQQAIAYDRKRNPQAGPHLHPDEHDEDQGYFDRVGTNIKRGIESMYDSEAPVPGDITGPPPAKDPRPVRVASTDPTSPNHLRKKINALHKSGRISRETKIAARRALHGKGGKYDPEMGVEAAMAILRDAGVRIDLKEAYEVVPGSGEEGVSGLSVPAQSMVRPEPEEEMSPAALRKQRALIWKLMQDEGEVDPTARFKPRANTRDTSGLRQAEFEDVYAKLYNLYSGEDIGQPGDATRLPDSFAERKPRGSDEDFIAKAALEEIIREEVMAHPAITSWGDKRLKQLAKKKKAARDSRAYEDRVARAEEEPGFQWALEADDEGWGPGSLEEMIREETEAVLAEDMESTTVASVWKEWCDGRVRQWPTDGEGKDLSINTMPLALRMTCKAKANRAWQAKKQGK